MRANHGGAVTHRRSCQRVSPPPPPHRLALEACRSQLHVRARALHQPLFCHFLSPPVGGPILDSAGGIRTTSRAHEARDQVLIERDETPVMFKRVPDEANAISRGMAEVEKAVGLHGRKYYGAFDNNGEYRVC